MASCIAGVPTWWTTQSPTWTTSDMLELRAEANRASVSLNDKTAIMLLWHAILLKRNPKHTMQKDGLP